MTDSVPLIAAAGLVLASHVVPSWPGVREWMVGRLGRVGYGLVHSVGSTVALVALILAYGAVDERTMVFVPSTDSVLVAVSLMPFAFVLIALRLASPIGDPNAPAAPTGIYRLVRSPGALGVLVWALAHLQTTGDTPRVTIFTTMAAVGAFSMVRNTITLRRAASHPDGVAARRFLNATSLVPGWAIVSGRTRFASGEWTRPGTWTAIAGGLLAYGAMAYMHPLIFGIDPFSLIN